MKQIYILLTSLLISNISYGQIGNWINFDGYDDGIEILNNGSGILGDNTNNESYTIEGKIYLTAYPNNNGALFSKHGPDGGFTLEMNSSGYIKAVQAITASGSNNSIITSSNPLSLNTWYHVAMTFDLMTLELKLYVDGSLNGTDTLTSFGFISNNAGIGNGYAGWSNPFISNIDELRIWNIVRTATELTNNSNVELTLPQTGLIAYYKFNEGVANGDNTAITSLMDELGNNNGTLQNLTLNGTVSNFINFDVLGINQYVNQEKEISFYPNPANDFIQLSGLTVKENYIIYNISGQEIKKGTIFENEKIDIKNFTNGLYLLKFDNGNTQKFLKE